MNDLLGENAKDLAYHTVRVIVLWALMRLVPMVTMSVVVIVIAMLLTGRRTGKRMDIGRPSERRGGEAQARQEQHRAT